MRAALLAAILAVAGCSAAAPSGGEASSTTLTSTSTANETPAAASPSTEPEASPDQSQAVSVRAPSGVATVATVGGTIYLGFEACVGLTPDASSAYLPPAGQDDFVLAFPKGWNIVAAHPHHPRFGDQFEIRDRDGKLVAHDGDHLQVSGEIRAIEATYCGFGWPITVREARRSGGGP